MSFTDTQLRQLRARLNPDHVRSRVSEGQILSYLEGWHVIAEANRIFGFDGWDRETVASTCVYTKQVGERYCAAYTAKVRITVRTGDRQIVREGSGAGEASVSSPGQAHDVAAKAAETDATKRALMTFGNAFGLSLYSGNPELRAKPRPMAERRLSPRQVSGAVATGKALAEAVTPTAVSGVDALGEAGETLWGQASPVGGGAPIDARLLLPAPSATDAEDLAGLTVERRERVDKAALTLAEPRRIRDPRHLASVAARPCLICGRNRSHAHHLKFAQPTALGRKVSDEFTVPLCPVHHGELHQYGDERVWWAAHGIDALKVAEELWRSRRRSPSDVEPARVVQAAAEGIAQ